MTHDPTATSEADERLFRELRAVVNHRDPVPPEVLTAARATLTWRTVDAELAELTFDSLTEDRELAGVRGASSARVLIYEGQGLSVEIEVAVAGDRRRILGQLVPAQRSEVQVCDANGVTTVDSDEDGRFRIDDTAGGPMRLRCVTAAGAVVQTDWVSV